MSRFAASLVAIAMLSLAAPFVPGTGVASAQDKKEEKKEAKKKVVKKTDAKTTDKVAETPKKKKSAGC